jgi:ABC-type uncharacterized transport system fused permease/ATPase subunit
MALAELQADADELKEEFDRIAGRVQQIETAVSTLTGSGSSLSKLSAVAPVIEVAVQALKTRHEGK